MPAIVRRSEWGFDGWNGTPYSVDEQAHRTEFFVHYDGGNPVLHRVGFSVPRAIHAYHKRQGWKGIGYGHVIDARGTIFEGRGFDLVGSHCKGFNTSGYSVQIHIGGDEKPTAAQLASARWLYDEACRRSGRALAKRGHRDGFATTCPGDTLQAWVRAGMPALMGSGGGGTTSPVGGTAGGGTRYEEDDVALDDKVPFTDAERRTLGVPDGHTGWDSLKDATVARKYGYRAARDAAAALEVVKALAAKGGMSTVDVEAAAERGARKAIDDEIDNATVTLNTGGTP